MMTTLKRAPAHSTLAVAAGIALVGAVAGVALSDVIPRERALMLWLATAVLVGLISRHVSSGNEAHWWKAPFLALAPAISLATMLAVIVVLYRDGVISGNLEISQVPGGLRVVLAVIAGGTWIACTLAIWASPVVVGFMQDALGLTDSTMARVTKILTWAIAVVGLLYTLSSTVVSGPQPNDRSTPASTRELKP